MGIQNADAGMFFGGVASASAAAHSTTFESICPVDYIIQDQRVLRRASFVMVGDLASKEGVLERRREWPALTQVYVQQGDTNIASPARFDGYYIEEWLPRLDLEVVPRGLGDIIRAGGW